MTADHSVLQMGCSVKVGQLAEEREAVVDFVAGELLQDARCQNARR